MTTKMPVRWLGRMAALTAALCVPVIATAQNCVLCYTQAGGSGPRMIQALRSGIVILVIPPMMICIGITWMAYKKRNECNDDGVLEPQEPDAKP
jgi:hypothetical protein